MPRYLVQAPAAAIHRPDLGERLARIRRQRPGALLWVRPAPGGLQALVQVQDEQDAQAVWAMGSLASQGVEELPAGYGARKGKRTPLQEGDDTMEESLILARALARGEAGNLPYRGAVTPEEAWLLLKLRSDARLLDVRSGAELELVGRIPGALEVEFMTYPDWQESPDFPTRVRQQVADGALLLLICRSGQRSHRAAALLAAQGLGLCFNVLEGFEGERDGAGHRLLNGWRQRGLPWEH